ncbi:gamma subclass chorismate mutase AroQ [Clavibacter zhangzhiyongii]|uniref:chorismate mutase n=1 Tax=Clavibacter zhangzhiyongii TaxID=2768071 RepID=A0A7L7Z2W3_9MICO|nr:gamma subclass chorismate mutase AroQ [Clavibacter zhangzhiyongii]QOD43985.1 gamma subclass chorismate mutase AroQ [Clavibacter zhangzhiyongii]
MPHRALLATSAFAVSLAALLGAAAPAQACPRDPAEQRAVTAVASAALDRLEIADDVAASKWLSGKAVADPAREQAVIDATVAAAEADGVDPVAAERIMRAQIEASKQVQVALIARWHAHLEEAPTTAPDLTTSVRPRINAVDARLVPAVGAAHDALDDRACGHLVTDARGELGRGLDDAHRKAFRTALATVCTPAS